MYKNRKKRQIRDIEPTSEERNEELLAAREEIEFLHQLVETQNTHIYHLENELLEATQELEVITDELNKTIMSGVSFDEAKAIAKTMLQNQKCSSELVEELLNIIYSLSVTPEELKKKVQFSIQSSQENYRLASKVIAQSRELRNNSKELRLRYQELGFIFISIRANLTKMQEHLTNYNKSLGQNNSIISNTALNQGDAYGTPFNRKTIT